MRAFDQVCSSDNRYLAQSLYRGHQDLSNLLLAPCCLCPSTWQARYICMSACMHAMHQHPGLWAPGSGIAVLL